MEAYYIYLLDAQDRITSRFDVECESDQDAIRKAAEKIGSHPAIEIWMGSRRVAHMTAKQLAERF
jgi:hypothetical protein